MAITFGLATAGVADGSHAAEIAGADGAVTVNFDDTIWSAERDEQGEPELTCRGEDCGGDSVGCGLVTVTLEGEGLTRDAFLGSFREYLDEKTLESARTNAGDSAEPQIVSPSSVAEFGGNTGVALSMRIQFDGAPTRVDHFWLLAGKDLAGLTCVAAEAEYSRARPAFERIFADLAVNPP